MKFEHFTMAALATSLNRSKTLEGADRPLQVIFDDDAATTRVSEQPKQPAVTPAAPPTQTTGIYVTNVPPMLVRAAPCPKGCNFSTNLRSTANATQTETDLRVFFTPFGVVEELSRLYFLETGKNAAG